MSLLRSSLVACALFVAAGSAMASPRFTPQRHVQALDRMMQALAHESARGAAAIRVAYEEHLELLFLGEYAALEGSLANGGLVPLPDNPRRFNLVPRLDGLHPIGEKDLDNQDSYVAARPFTIGCLLEIASRVHSGPLEITSLVRHGEYQDALRRTNANANASVPTHTMGLAIDIALVNTPIETVQEIRDVLREMRDAGDLLFIGERQQLVFHVVPHPSRLGHFTDVYTSALGAPAAAQAAEVIARVPSAAEVAPPTRTPRVTAEVLSIAPADASLDEEWWKQMAAAASPIAISAPPQPPVLVHAAVPLLARGLLPLAPAAMVALLTIVRRRHD